MVIEKSYILKLIHQLEDNYTCVLLVNGIHKIEKKINFESQKINGEIER